MLFFDNVVTFRGNEPGVNPIRTAQGIERSDCCLQKSVLKLQLRILSIELTEDAGVLSFKPCRNLDYSSSNCPINAESGWVAPSLGIT